MRAIITIFILLIIAVSFLMTRRDSGHIKDASFTAMDGRSVNLFDMRGKVVLIDFWATWSQPSRDEIPDIVKVYNDYHTRGFEVIGVSLDQNRDDVVSFMNEQSMTWPEYFDGGGWQTAFAVKYGVKNLGMWLLNERGDIVTKDASDNLSGRVEKLLGDKE